MADDERTFTPAADVTEALNNGRGAVVVARAGEPIPWTRAQALGLIDGDGKPTVKGATHQPDAAPKPHAGGKKGGDDAPAAG